MPRTKGSRNHKPCAYCGVDIVFRQKTNGDWKAFVYDAHRNEGTTPHLCSPYKAPQPVVDPPVVDPVVVEPEPVVEEPATDFFSSLNTAIENRIAEGLKKAAGEIAALRQEIIDQGPRTHQIQITVGDNTPVTVEGRPHALLGTVIKQLARGHHLWLCGPAGSGKTTVASQAAEALGLELQEISCGPATDQWELFGHLSPDGRYIPGKIRKVFEEGGLLMVDEIDNADPSVLTTLNNILSKKNGKVSFPDGMVEKHPDFVCLAGANTYGRGADRMYVGRNKIDAASLDRFGFLPFDYDEEAEMEWVGNDQSRWVDYIQAVRHAAQERKLEVVVSPRASIFGAEDLRQGDTWDEVANTWIFAKMSPADREMLQAAVNMPNITQEG